MVKPVALRDPEPESPSNKIATFQVVFRVPTELNVGELEELQDLLACLISDGMVDRKLVGSMYKHVDPSALNVFCLSNLEVRPSIGFKDGFPDG